MKDEAFVRRYPAVLEYLSSCVWPDGKKRETSTILLFVEDGRWKACFSDRDGQRVAFVTGDTLEGLLGALETGLVEDRLDWRKKREEKKK